MKLKIGDLVQLRPRIARATHNWKSATITAFLDDGEVVLNHKLGLFRLWNVEDLRKVKKKGKMK